MPHICVSHYLHQCWVIVNWTLRNKLQWDLNLLWKLNDKGTHVKFCWIPSHCGIEGNEAADKLAKESLGLNIDALLGINHADLKPQVNAYVQQLTQVKWDVEVHGRDLYLLKANLAPPDRYKHLKRAEEVAMTRLRIGHCKATKGHIVSRGPPAVCHHCQENITRMWHSPRTPWRVLRSRFSDFPLWVCTPLSDRWVSEGGWILLPDLTSLWKWEK